MKKADLEKLKGSKIAGQVKAPGSAARFGTPPTPDRREQRRLDQARGLVPFAVKLNSELVKEIQALAQTRGEGVNEIVDALLRKGLEG